MSEIKVNELSEKVVVEDVALPVEVVALVIALREKGLDLDLRVIKAYEEALREGLRVAEKRREADVREARHELALAERSELEARHMELLPYILEADTPFIRTLRRSPRQPKIYAVSERTVDVYFEFWDERGSLTGIHKKSVYQPSTARKICEAMSTKGTPKVVAKKTQKTLALEQEAELGYTNNPMAKDVAAYALLAVLIGAMLYIACTTKL